MSIENNVSHNLRESEVVLNSPDVHSLLFDSCYVSYPKGRFMRVLDRIDRKMATRLTPQQEGEPSYNLN